MISVRTIRTISLLCCFCDLQESNKADGKAATRKSCDPEVKAPEVAPPAADKPKPEVRLRRSQSKVKLKAPKLDKILHCLFYKVKKIHDLPRDNS